MTQNVPKDRIIEYLTPGTILWRQCHLYTRGIEFHNTQFEYSADPNYPGHVCKTALAGGGKYLFEPVVDKIDTSGIVTFIDDMPPPDWTHLIVKAISGKRNTVFAEWNGSLPRDEYFRFRRGYFDAVTRAEQSGADYFNVNYRLTIAKQQEIKIPHMLHRAFFSRQDPYSWAVESPLESREPIRF